MRHRDQFKYATFLLAGLLAVGTASAATRFIGEGNWNDVSPSPGWDNGVAKRFDEARLLKTDTVTIQSWTAAVVSYVSLAICGTGTAGTLGQFRRNPYSKQPSHGACGV